MATLVLGAAGSSFGPLGTAAGSLLGSFIDNFIIFPLLFPKKGVNAPSIDGVYLSSGNEGSPMNWFLGPRTRVGGTFIHVFELEVTENKQQIGKGGGGSVTTREFYVSFAVAFGEASPQSVSRLREVIADVKRVYRDGPVGSLDSIVFYDGSQTTPDPFLESKLGVGKVPIYKNQVYVVVERLFLGDFANRVPNLQAVIEQTSDLALQDAISLSLVRAGYEISDFDVTGVRPCVRGVNFSGVVATSDVLEAMGGVYAVSLQEVDSKLVFRSRGTELQQLVDHAHLLDGLHFIDSPQLNLPDEVAFDFLDDDLDIQPGVARFRDLAQGGGVQNQVRVTSPFTHSSAEADALARLHYAALRGESRGVEFGLPPSYVHLAAGDVVQVTDPGGEVHVIYLDRVELTPTGRIACRGRLTEPDLFEHDGVGDNAGYDAGSGATPTLRSWIGDLPALVDLETQDIVAHWGSQAETGSFRRVSLVVGTDAVSEVSSPAVMGVTRSGPGAPASLLTFDESSPIEVEMFNGAVLAASTDTEVALGQENILAIQAASGDWEVLGFVDVTPLGDGRFLLSRLLRGLRGTEVYVGDHLPSGARVVVLTAGANKIGVWRAGTTYLGTSPSVRFVPAGATVEEIDPTQVAIRGRTMTPFAPTHPEAWWRLVSASVWDVEIQWRRRSKRFFDPISADAPLGDDEPGTFRLRIVRAGLDSAVVRELVLSEERFTYTQAMREEDVDSGRLPSTSSGFGIVVQQVSSVVGLGYPLWFTIGANA